MKTILINEKKCHLLSIQDGSANFIAAYILQFLLQFIMTVVLLATGVNETFTKTLTYTFIICTVNQMANLAAPFAYSKIKGANIVKEAGWKWNLSIVQVILLICISIFTVCAFSPIANWFVEFIYWTGFDSSSLTSMTFTTPSTLALGIFFICVMPAVIEETLYRGIVARSFASKNYIFAIFLSAFIFAIMHGNPVQLVHQFCLGCVCALVYFMTRSIYASMIVHLVNNLVAVVGSYVLTALKITTTSTLVYVIVMIVGLIVLPILIYLLYTTCVKRKKEQLQTVHGINKKLEVLFATEEEANYQNQIDNQIAATMSTLDSDEKKEVYMMAVHESNSRNGLKDRRALLYALLLGLGVWIINTILCYV